MIIEGLNREENILIQKEMVKKNYKKMDRLPLEGLN